MMRPMSELGDLLVLLHGARRRISTVRATLRLWQDLVGRQAALAPLVERGEVTAYAASDDTDPETQELVRVWLAPPDRAREEREGAARVAVRRGPLWWHYDPESGAVSNEDEPDVAGGGGESYWWLLDPAPVIGLLEFGRIEPGRRAGRPTWRVRAVPRTLGDAADDWPLLRLAAWGADELRLDVDAERGALLRVESRFEGRPIEVSEVLEIGFDEVFAPGTFVFTPPPGETVRSIRSEPGVRTRLTIEQAVALAPFTVWIPARVPADWEVEIGFAEASDRPPIAPHVHLHYRAADGTHGVSIAESPAGHPGEHDEYDHARPGPWRAVEREQRRMQVREPAENWQPAQVRMELDGTRILMHSRDLGADALADLAAGLVPAPSVPPRLG